MIEHSLLLLIGVSLCQGGYHKPDECYHYYDHTAKYKLCHDDRGYPTNEINLVLQSYPAMKDMFYEDKHPLPAPASHYPTPPKAVCPYNRYTLYSFFYANKDCFVIYPDVQKITYVQCSADNNRQCQQCANYGGVSKCDEDYSYQYVWAYCTYKDPVAHPEPVPVIQPDVTQQVQNVRVRVPEPEEPKYYDRIDSGPVYLRSDYYVKAKPQPKQVQPRTVHQDASVMYKYKDPWNKLYRPYLLQHRWKRSYHEPQVTGTIERKKLYLPHHCGCKKFVC